MVRVQREPGEIGGTRYSQSTGGLEGQSSKVSEIFLHSKSDHSTTPVNDGIMSEFHVLINIHGPS